MNGIDKRTYLTGLAMEAIIIANAENFNIASIESSVELWENEIARASTSIADACIRSGYEM